MNAVESQVSWGERERWIAAFESARAADPQVELGEFLPPAGDRQRRAVLHELIRIDLEQKAGRGELICMDAVLAEFPELRDDAEGLAGIAFEEYRLRRQAGEDVLAAGYRQRLGITVSGWPEVEFEDVGPKTNLLDDQQQQNLDRAALSYRKALPPSDAPAGAALSREEADRLNDLHDVDPRAAERAARAVTSMPQVGTCFLGFELVGELGRGAFGRVFLAAQVELGQRQVALKVSANLRGEPQVLARLQHTNVVPVYSVHTSGALQAVCMPYLGGTTLADVIKQLQAETPPASGASLVQTLQNQKSRTAVDSSAVALAPRVAEQPAVREPAPLPDTVAGQTTAILDKLQGLSYVDAVLWITARLAEGLAHAHERGILHSDLKPANVLLTDEGQPMLLDFNLAVDTSNHVDGRAAVVGGTLPYMAPEHLQALQDRKTTIDTRSDIYSLGIILYELLTCRHPFPQRPGKISEVLPAMIAERGKAPAVRIGNRAIAPAVESIVQRCLAPDPAGRYQTARELLDDIELHCADLPLRHAPNPSLGERLAKWKRRHPRLTSSTAISLVAAVVVAGLLGVLEVRGQHLARLNALQTFQHFRAEARIAQPGIYGNRVDHAQHVEAMAACRQTLDIYQVLTNPNWRDLPEVANLPMEERSRLIENIADLLLMSARCSVLLLPSETDNRQRALDDSLQFNRLAESCYEPDEMPRAVWDQRALLCKLAGDDAEAMRWRERAEPLPSQSPRELYWRAADRVLERRHADAGPLLEEAVRQDPQNFRAWFVLAGCHYEAGRDADAQACYTTCIALEPDSPWPYFNRGLVYLRQADQGKAPDKTKYVKAHADFDKALALRPKLADAYFNRALAAEGLDKLKDALADLNDAERLAGEPTYILFHRALVWDKLGEPAKAKADRTEGLKREPGDERSWIARGLARLPADPRGALADLDAALRLNPLSIVALQNRAHVLAEQLPILPGDLPFPVNVLAERQKAEHTRQAIAALDKALELAPDFTPARSGRGVLFARLGQRAKALADAREVVKRDTTPQTLYEVACIYALTTRQQPNDRLEAFRLLWTALREGFGSDLVESDTDLDALRPAPEFRRLLETARSLRATPP